MQKHAPRGADFNDIFMFFTCKMMFPVRLYKDSLPARQILIVRPQLSTVNSRHGKLACKRPSFARRKGTFCSVKGALSQVCWQSGGYGLAPAGLGGCGRRQPCRSAQTVDEGSVLFRACAVCVAVKYRLLCPAAVKIFIIPCPPFMEKY